MLCYILELQQKIKINSHKESLNKNHSEKMKIMDVCSILVDKCKPGHLYVHWKY